MPIYPRLELEYVSQIPHGGYQKRFGEPELLDFSANVNPFGPTPRLWEALQKVPLGQHPDPRATTLRHFLANLLGLSTQQILIGNGSIELIYQIAVAYLRPKDQVLIVEPTFGEYAAASMMMGAEIIRWQTKLENSFALNIEEFGAFLRKNQPRLLFLCNPNNPTGLFRQCEEIEYILQQAPETLFILDEAFVRFVNHAWSALPLLKYENLLILRSLTKDYALTGLRVGYAVAAPTIIAALAKVQPPWSVNALAQTGAIAALCDEAHLQTSLAALAQAKKEFVNDLIALGQKVLASEVNFFLLRVDSARIWAQKLREKGILVRDTTSFGLPNTIRVATRQAVENKHFVETIKNILKG